MAQRNPLPTKNFFVLMQRGFEAEPIAVYSCVLSAVGDSPLPAALSFNTFFFRGLLSSSSTCRASRHHQACGRITLHVAFSVACGRCQLCAARCCAERGCCRAYERWILCTKSL